MLTHLTNTVVKMVGVQQSIESELELNSGSNAAKVQCHFRNLSVGFTIFVGGGFSSCDIGILRKFIKVGGTFSLMVALADMLVFASILQKSYLQAK